MSGLFELNLKVVICQCLYNIHLSKKTLHFISGHSDTVIGAIATNDDELYKKLKFLQNGQFLYVHHVFLPSF